MLKPIPMKNTMFCRNVGSHNVSCFEDVSREKLEHNVPNCEVRIRTPIWSGVSNLIKRLLRSLICESDWEQALFTCMLLGQQKIARTEFQKLFLRFILVNVIRILVYPKCKKEDIHLQFFHDEESQSENNRKTLLTSITNHHLLVSTSKDTRKHSPSLSYFWASM